MYGGVGVGAGVCVCMFGGGPRLGDQNGGRSMVVHIFWFVSNL